MGECGTRGHEGPIVFFSWLSTCSPGRCVRGSTRGAGLADVPTTLATNPNFTLTQLPESPNLILAKAQMKVYIY